MYKQQSPQELIEILKKKAYTATDEQKLRLLVAQLRWALSEGNYEHIKLFIRGYYLKNKYAATIGQQLTYYENPTYMRIDMIKEFQQFMEDQISSFKKHYKNKNITKQKYDQYVKEVLGSLDEIKNNLIKTI